MRLTVRTKLLGGFLLVIAMMVAVGLLAIVKLGAINKTTTQLGDNAVPALQNYALLNNATQGYRKDQLRYVTAIDARDRANMIDTVAEDLRNMDLGIRTGTTLASSRLGAARFRSFVDDWNAYVAATADYRRLADAGRERDAIVLMTVGGGKEAFDAVKASLRAATDFRGRSSTDLANRANDTVASTRTIIVVLLIAAALAGIAIALLLSRGIVGGVRQMLAAARGIAGGDVEQQIEIKSRDEIGETGEAFRRWSPTSTRPPTRRAGSPPATSPSRSPRSPTETRSAPPSRR